MNREQADSALFSFYVCDSNYDYILLSNPIFLFSSCLVFFIIFCLLSFGDSKSVWPLPVIKRENLRYSEVLLPTSVFGIWVALFFL